MKPTVKTTGRKFIFHRGWDPGKPHRYHKNLVLFSLIPNLLVLLIFQHLHRSRIRTRVNKLDHRIKDHGEQIRFSLARLYPHVREALYTVSPVVLPLSLSPHFGVHALLGVEHHLKGMVSGLLLWGQRRHLIVRYFMSNIVCNFFSGYISMIFTCMID